jgi:hypothetical protein
MKYIYYLVRFHAYFTCLAIGMLLRDNFSAQACMDIIYVTVATEMVILGFIFVRLGRERGWVRMAVRK